MASEDGHGSTFAQFTILDRYMSTLMKVDASSPKFHHAKAHSAILCLLWLIAANNSPIPVAGHHFPLPTPIHVDVAICRPRK